MKTQQLINEALQTERDYTAQIIHGIPSLVVGIQPDGTTRFVNPAVENVTGYSTEEIIGKNWWKVLYPGEAYSQVEKLFKDFEKGPVRDYEMILTTKSGAKKIVAWNSLNHFDANGELIEVIGFGNDITARKQAEQELKTQQVLAASIAKMSALGEMAAGVAHEINTPLATISLLSGRLRAMVTSGEVNPQFFQDAINSIEATCMRISKIIKALKTFSRNAESDPYRKVRLSSIIEDTLALCQEKLKFHAIDLQIDSHSPVIEAECQSVQISQVLLNLLNNAVDAVEKLPQKWIRIDCREADNHVELSITDSGSGIEPRVAESIMQPFFTTKEFGKGTGLGLSISKGIIETHQGRLFLDRNCAHTRFTILLPKIHVP